MACMYDVPHLACIVEMTLLGMLNMDNCCSMLSVVDHHQAAQLRAASTSSEKGEAAEKIRWLTAT